MDGNNTQIGAVTAEAAARSVTVTIIIDLIHVLEYLWKAAWSFFGKGEPAAEEWVADQARKILHGNARQVAAGIRRRATTYGYSPAERAGADECARYLENKKDYLDYATALTQGWPIATGIIEGACRYIVKDRMDITGARWASKAPRPSSSSAPSPPPPPPPATSTPTGATTCAENTNASTTPATAKRTSSQRNQLTSKELHPSGLACLSPGS